MAANTGANSTTRDPLGKDAPPSEKAYENFNISAARESLNGLPFSASDQAKGNVENPTLSKALMTIKMEDFKSLHQKPCVRDALLVGIGVGFGLGGIRASLGGQSSLQYICCISNIHSTDSESLQLGCW